MTEAMNAGYYNHLADMDIRFRRIGTVEKVIGLGYRKQSSPHLKGYRIDPVAEPRQFVPLPMCEYGREFAGRWETYRASHRDQ